MQRSLVLLPTLVSTLLLVGACHTSPPAGPSSNAANEAEQAASTTPGPVVVQPSPEEGEGEAPQARGPELPSGALCDTNADCGDDEVCEGVGCEPGQGRCAPKERMCTRDLAPYCGCDGEMFQASGSCAGGRYAYRGPCDPKLEDGEACTDGRQCKSGACVGEGLEGCGRGTGVCGQADCTRDMMPYCSCNGTEFSTSGSCPNRQFAYRGPCEAVGE